MGARVIVLESQAAAAFPQLLSGVCLNADFHAGNEQQPAASKAEAAGGVQDLSFINEATCE